MRSDIPVDLVEPSLEIKRNVLKGCHYVFTIPTFGQISMISKPYQVSDLISPNIGKLDTASDWLIGNLDRVM